MRRSAMTPVTKANLSHEKDDLFVDWPSPRERTHTGEVFPRFGR